MSCAPIGSAPLLARLLDGLRRAVRDGRVALVAVIGGALLTACGGSDVGTASNPATSSIRIAAPADGSTVSGPVTFDMVADGLRVEPAGEVVDGSGHFHLMIDTECIEPGQVIPADDQHLHFGDGSDTATLDLPPGEYSICLQAGDGFHTALDLTDTILLTVVN